MKRQVQLNRSFYAKSRKLVMLFHALLTAFKMAITKTYICFHLQHPCFWTTDYLNILHALTDRESVKNVELKTTCVVVVLGKFYVILSHSFFWLHSHFPLVESLSCYWDADTLSPAFIFFIKSQV